MKTIRLEGNIVDVVNRRVFKGRIEAQNGVITKVTEEDVSATTFLIPGLIDAHVHIESSMLIPSEFARLAVAHGMVASVSDPHEIGNVLGVDGVKYMIENGKKVPFKFFFGAPSCVPATPFETAGATITADDIDTLLAQDEVKYLAEMMNFPGVLNADPMVMEKLAVAKKYHKPVDGHAPGVLGEAAMKYAAAGITTDHECFTREEAVDKIKAGMLVQIREGSAAKNFAELVSLLNDYPEKVMFCSDDKHPDNLAEGHINLLMAKAIELGYDLVDVICAATKIPKEHYKLNTGLLQEGDAADIVVIDNPSDFNILETYIDGVLVAENGHSKLKSVAAEAPNVFHATKLDVEALRVVPETDRMFVFKAIEGQLITDKLEVTPKVIDNNVVSDVQNDVLKIVVLNRYRNTKPAVAFIHNIGIKKGAIASSVAHDSHNIIAVGVSDDDIVTVINEVIEHKGGISWTDGVQKDVLPLPVAGIMSKESGYEVASKYKALDQKAKAIGSHLHAPYMTLSFMALLVIPHLKLSDKGLFDGDKFKFIDVFVKN